ncbi:hypothetical protein B0H13DRAFT_2299991 [Mycena leptocephala]|nr:hypothetical protein B0H13DRAFT_2299991 [Mycena leptocephala]
MSDSDTSTVDIVPRLRALEEASRSHETLHAPLAVQEALDLLLAYVADVDCNNIGPDVPPPRTITPPPDRPLQPNVQYNVKMNTRTTLETLYIHDSDALIEFPETSATGSVGHLFRMKADASWFNPTRNVVYSQ